MPELISQVKIVDYDHLIVSESVYRAHQGLELSVEDLGDVALKGIEQPVSFYRMA